MEKKGKEKYYHFFKIKSLSHDSNAACVVKTMSTLYLDCADMLCIAWNVRKRCIESKKMMWGFDFLLALSATKACLATTSSTSQHNNFWIRKKKLMPKWWKCLIFLWISSFIRDIMHMLEPLKTDRSISIILEFI